MSKKNKVKNASRIVVGQVQEAAGHAVGNNKLVVKGKSTQMMGKIRQVGEKIKESFHA